MNLPHLTVTQCAHQAPSNASMSSLYRSILWRPKTANSKFHVAVLLLHFLKISSERF